MKKYLLLTAFLLMVALRCISSQGYYQDGITVNGPHGNYTSMLGENHCWACHLSTATTWAVLPIMTCMPTGTFRQTTCFRVRSSWRWKGSFNAGRQYLDASCLSCHNSAGMGTPKMVLTGALATILMGGPAPLASYSLSTGQVMVYGNGTSLSSGPPLSSTDYQCPRCHEPHFEQRTGLNYLKPGVI